MSKKRLSWLTSNHPSTSVLRLAEGEFIPPDLELQTWRDAADDKNFQIIRRCSSQLHIKQYCKKHFGKTFKHSFVIVGQLDVKADTLSQRTQVLNQPEHLGHQQDAGLYGVAIHHLVIFNAGEERKQAEKQTQSISELLLER